jgi:hypothetical protein
VGQRPPLRGRQWRDLCLRILGHQAAARCSRSPSPPTLPIRSSARQRRRVHGPRLARTCAEAKMRADQSREQYEKRWEPSGEQCVTMSGWFNALRIVSLSPTGEGGPLPSEQRTSKKGGERAYRVASEGLEFRRRRSFHCGCKKNITARSRHRPKPSRTWVADRTFDLGRNERHSNGLVFSICLFLTAIHRQRKGHEFRAAS